VWFGTLSNSFEIESYLADLKDKSAVVGLGLQWAALDNVAEIHEQFPELLLMQTEHRMGNYPFQSSSFPDYYRHNPDQEVAERAPNDYDYARESWDWIVNWMTRGVHSYHAAHLVLDTSGLGLNLEQVWHQNALLVVDRDSASLIETPFYWVLRHVAQYVRPGAVRLETEGGEALAFRNTEGSLIAIVHNPVGEEVQVSVTDGTTTHAFALPAYGFATVSFGIDG
jgi:glucosylceramidase